MQMEEGGGSSSRRLTVLRGHLAAGERAVKAVQCSGSSTYSAPVSSSKDERQRAFPRERWGKSSWIWRPFSARRTCIQADSGEVEWMGLQGLVFLHEPQRTGRVQRKKVRYGIRACGGSTSSRVRYNYSLEMCATAQHTRIALVAISYSVQV